MLSGRHSHVAYIHWTHLTLLSCYLDSMEHTKMLFFSLFRDIKSNKNTNVLQQIKHMSDNTHFGILSQ